MSERANLWYSSLRMERSERKTEGDILKLICGCEVGVGKLSMSGCKR